MLRNPNASIVRTSKTHRPNQKNDSQQSLNSVGTPSSVAATSPVTVYINTSRENDHSSVVDRLLSDHILWVVVGVCILFLWRKTITRLLDAFILRIERGAKVKVGPLTLEEPPFTVDIPFRIERVEEIERI